MMKLKIGDKELSIQFAYKPTLKERVISKIVKIANITAEDGETDIEKVEDLLLYLPEVLLVGLQMHHEEYRYNYDTKNGKEEQLDKTFNLIDEYSVQEDSSLIQLFNDLQEEMQKNSFLAKLFQEEQKKAQTTKKVKN